MTAWAVREDIREHQITPATERYDYSSIWYNVPLIINKMILKRCDIGGKLKMATISPVDRELLNCSIPLFPKGIALVSEDQIFIVCRRLFIEKITFRLRWSQSRNSFIIFGSRSAHVQPIEPTEKPMAVPLKVVRYLRKKSAFEALYNEKIDEHFIVGMGNSCDFRFPR